MKHTYNTSCHFLKKNSHSDELHWSYHNLSSKLNNNLVSGPQKFSSLLRKVKT